MSDHHAHGGHHHGHPHHHGGSETRAIGIAFTLNLVFALVELAGGLWVNSVAVLADALHDFGDAFALGIGWYLARLALREADPAYSYGYQRWSLLGALIGSLVLVGGSVLVLVESVPRLWAPEMPHAPGMLALAVLGVLVNGYAALQLRRSGTLNAQAMSWHLLEDVLGWVAVLVVACVLLVADWPVLDPLLSVLFTLYILRHVFGVLRDTAAVFLQGVPAGHRVRDVEALLLADAQVAAVHHTRLWTLDGEQHVFTTHVVVTEALDAAALVALKQRLQDLLAGQGFRHTTVELELPGECCRDGAGLACPPRPGVL